MARAKFYYAYTLQGWLKAINPDIYTGGSYTLRPDSLGNVVAASAYNLLLNYYDGDYKPISGVAGPDNGVAAALGGGYKALFNGNISSMGTRVRGLNNTLLYSYQYDQLNRLVGMDAWNRTGAAWNALSPVDDFKERIAYDPNGNILQYLRNGNHTFAGKPLAMDSLGYKYIAGSNKLDHITDAVAPTTPVPYDDIQAQSTGNYKYDSIGQLISDDAAGISNISWTVYGKIASITKGGDTTIYYTYDAGGNRISKSVVHGTDTTATWYVRDAQGNVLSVYTYGDPSVHGRDLTQTELHIYGSSRLGIWKRNVDVELAPPITTSAMPLLGSGDSITFTRGNKLFELTNHLGNVLATISDKRYGIVTASGDSNIAYFIPDLVSANDYYPFGMLQPYRSYAKSGAVYRYGFNGKENDNEVKGVGDQIDYGMRVYDPRIGKFLSVDPLTKKYPGLTPYQFASNRPIDGIDQDGGEWKKVATYDPKTGVKNIQFQVKLSLVNDSKVFNNIKELIPELQRQVKSSFEAANTDKIHYSATIDVKADKDPGRYSAILYDRQKGNLISGIETGEPNTQDNAVSVAAANNADPATPGSGNSRDIKLIAQDIIHELLHTANVKHPHDPDNNAEDVDVKPEFKIEPNGKKVFDTYVPIINANFALIIHNIMIYGDVPVNGKKVKQYEHDPSKRGEISPDQAKIVTQQVDIDTKTKQ